MDALTPIAARRTARRARAAAARQARLTWDAWAARPHDAALQARAEAARRAARRLCAIADALVEEAA